MPFIGLSVSASVVAAAAETAYRGNVVATHDELMMQGDYLPTETG